MLFRSFLNCAAEIAGMQAARTMAVVNEFLANVVMANYPLSRTGTCCFSVRPHFLISGCQRHQLRPLYPVSQQTAEANGLFKASIRAKTTFNHNITMQPIQKTKGRNLSGNAGWLRLQCCGDSMSIRMLKSHVLQSRKFTVFYAAISPKISWTHSPKKPSR